MNKPARKSAPPAKKAAKKTAAKTKGAPVKASAQKPSLRRELFIAACIAGKDSKAAAIEAGYSEHTAAVQGCRLMKDPDVRKQVADGLAAIRAEVEEDTGVTLKETVKELARLALYDPADLVRQQLNCPEDIAKLPEDVRRVIAGWSWDKWGNFVVKLTSKTPNLDLLMKHLGGYEKDNQQKGGALAELLEQVTRSAIPIAKDLPAEGNDVG